MRENTVRKIWQEGGAVVNGWLQLTSPYASEVMAHQGWDSLTIDMQHGPVGYSDTIAMLQAISTTDVIPLARVPWNEPGIIMKMLDVGCYGIICPMINTRAEAEAFVGACRYPANGYGYRSIGPNRAGLYGGADYFANANETVITMAMIETAQAVENLDDILSVPGLDAIYVGPSDLSISLIGNPGGYPSDSKVVDTIEAIVEATKKHNIYAGIHTSSVEMALAMIEQGYQFTTVLSDAGLMGRAANQVVSAVKNKNADVQGGVY